MDQHLPSPRATPFRPMLLAAAGAVIIAVALGVFLHQRSTPVAPEPPAPLSVVTPSQPQPAAPPAPAKPSFDVVRIDPHGEAVMAGRAAPGSKVIISDAGKTIGEVQADTHGDWVYTPATPLPPGSRELTLAEQAPNGTETRGDRSVLLVVPATAAPATPALAVLTSPNTPPSVLTGPAPLGPHQQLAIGAMEYDDQGAVRFSGTAPPGAAIRLYVDNRPVAGIVADAHGRWTLAARDPLAAGNHSLRLDQLAPDGKVTARLERPFAREQMAAMQLPAGRVEIHPGQNLWTIARTTYGHGTNYLVIFQANRQQIRDPNLIYPGQVFALPVASPAEAMPASSSTSR